jgi:flagellar hook capping protein FlgD/SdrD B-like protein
MTALVMTARARASVLILAVLAFSVSFLPTTRAAAGTISGTAFHDLDRDGALDAGEPPMPGDRIYLFDAGGYLGQSTTDASGRYAFTGLSDGRYEVAYDASSWAPLQLELVPTTTGSITPSQTVDLSGSRVADFGWRPITWSTDPANPISTLVAPNGLRVQTYNDAVRPQEIVDAVMAGSVGAEAGSVTVRFALGSVSATATSVVSRDDVYEDFQATASVSYQSWLTNKDSTVSHEYGHAWSWYHAYMTLGDPTMAAYLAARGLAGDARVGSSYVWGVGELIAEDYRQLLGSPAGRSVPQANRDIPAAAAVPGLAAFLADTFTQKPTVPAPQPSPTPTATPTPSPTPTPSVDIVGLKVSPTIVKRTATITFGLTTAARVTIVVWDGTGQVIRTLLAETSEPAGSLNFVWDRTTDSGKRVRAGEYTVKVRADDANGGWDTALATFPTA